MTEDLVLVVALEAAEEEGKAEEEDIRHLAPTAIKRKLEKEKHNIDNSLELKCLLSIWCEKLNLLKLTNLDRSSTIYEEMAKMDVTAR